MLEEHEHKHAVHDFDGIIENRVTSPPVYFNVLFYGLIIWGVLFSAYYLFSDWSSEKEFNAEMSAYQQRQMTAEEQAAQAAETGKGPQKAGAVAAAGEKPEEIDAAGLYATHCAMCHGAEGEGGIGPDLTGTDYIYGRSHADVVSSISGGRPNGMPGFEQQLGQAEIQSLADYVLSLGEGKKTPVEAEEKAAVNTEQQAAAGTEKKSAAQQADPQTAATSKQTEAQPAVKVADIFAERCAMCHGADGAGSGIGPDLTAANYIYGKSQAEVVKSIRDGRSNGMPGFGKQLPQHEIAALAEYVREL